MAGNGSSKFNMSSRRSPKFNMIGRGSPKLSMFMAMASSSKAKKMEGGASPKGKSRACWNPALERSLVEILHEHNNTSFRGDNGWTTEGWNKMVKEFHVRNKYVSFTKSQVQEKERELKRDYRMLKEARKQSGCGWDEEKCMIVAEPALWDNLISSHPKIKKFRNNKASFPLFDSLGQLYDGRLAEGNHNFTSLEAPQEPLRQICDEDYEFQDLGETMPYQIDDETTNLTTTEDGDAYAERIVAPSRNEEGIGHSKRPADLTTNKEEQGKKAKKSSNVEAMMERYLDIRVKESEDAQGADYSIKRCISRLNLLDVTKTEKAKAYVVFKSKENREIFLSACEEDEESALIWLRTEMA